MYLWAAAEGLRIHIALSRRGVIHSLCAEAKCMQDMQDLARRLALRLPASPN